jgi:protein arginine N-methyltransferase 1
MKVKKEELSFQVPFRLVASRDDFCHAFVVFFDIEFTFCHKKVWFSTAPNEPYTHWKQTVFYLPEVLSIKKGEEVRGEFQCRPGSKNPRELEITISYSFIGAHDRSTVSQQYFLR